MLKKKLNILVATNHLNTLGGTETYTYTLIEELVHRENINVEYFTFHKGIVSDKIEKELKVNFKTKKKYDLILANHNVVVDKLSKAGFIIQTCHGIYPKLEQPSRKANAYVSISQEVQDYLCDLGLNSKIILNGINVERFKPTNDINKKLKTVLSLCHSENANKIIYNCCNKIKLNFIKINKYEDKIWEIEDIINKADLVIGLGRSAYEAMSCGRPVIIFDDRPYFESFGDGYLKNILGFSILNNCSGRYYKKVYGIKELSLEIKKYNISDGEFLRNFALKNLNIRFQLDKYLDFYLKTKKNNLKKKREKRDKFISTLITKKGLAYIKKYYSKFKNIL